MKKIGIILFCAFCMFLFVVFDSSVTRAVDYNSVCTENIVAESGNYKRCGSQHIYLSDDKAHSSHFVSTIELFGDSQMLYAGKIDGIETFYSSMFYLYAVVYDNRSIGHSDEDSWIDMSADNILVYDGSFSDNMLIDQSKNEVIKKVNKSGTYLIRQYVGREITNIVKIIVPEKTDYGLDIQNVKYGQDDINSNNLVGNHKALVIQIKGGKYGFNGIVGVKVNECSFEVEYSSKIIVSNDKFRQCLKYNEKNLVVITVYNGFNVGKVFKYNLKINSNDVSIRMEDSVSKVETSSRRILIQSYAGTGKTINEEYNLYYWSKSPNDKLTYNEFLTNYENSEIKGTYNGNRGVILRDKIGTYYLYAMAKDDDSTVVVRSSEYVLKKKEKLNKIVMDDVVIVSVLGALAIIPICIYLGIRGKDTD